MPSNKRKIFEEIFRRVWVVVFHKTSYNKDKKFRKTLTIIYRLQKGIVITMEILLLGGGLLIVIFAVVVSVVSSVVSAIAADQDHAED